MVQLLDDAREGGLQIARRGQLEVAAAGLAGELREPRVRTVRAAPAGAPAESAAPAARPAAVAAGGGGRPEPRVLMPREADGVEHHVLLLRRAHHTL